MTVAISKEHEMVRIGVIGYGYWGPNLVRNFAEVPDTQVLAVADMNSARLQVASRRYPGIRAVADIATC